jgi:hypothetical protein
MLLPLQARIQETGAKRAAFASLRELPFVRNAQQAIASISAEEENFVNANKG